MNRDRPSCSRPKYRNIKKLTSCARLCTISRDRSIRLTKSAGAQFAFANSTNSAFFMELFRPTNIAARAS